MKNQKSKPSSTTKNFTGNKPNSNFKNTKNLNSNYLKMKWSKPKLRQRIGNK